MSLAAMERDERDGLLVALESEERRLRADLGARLEPAQPILVFVIGVEWPQRPDVHGAADT